MESQPQREISSEPQSNSTSELGTTMRSGTGAPIFEPGPHTRIRRNPTRAIATVTWEGGPRETFGQILDVSLTGCLLRTESTIAPNTELALTVTIIGGGRDDTDFDVRGIVRRSTSVRGRRAYGLAFVAADSEERKVIQALYSETAH